jgi:hypothetical protein
LLNYCIIIFNSVKNKYLSTKKTTVNKVAAGT